MKRRSFISVLLVMVMMAGLLLVGCSEEKETDQGKSNTNSSSGQWSNSNSGKDNPVNNSDDDKNNTSSSTNANNTGSSNTGNTNNTNNTTNGDPNQIVADESLKYQFYGEWLISDSKGGYNIFWIPQTQVFTHGFVFYEDGTGALILTEGDRRVVGETNLEWGVDGSCYYIIFSEGTEVYAHLGGSSTDEDLIIISGVFAYNRTSLTLVHNGSEQMLLVPWVH